jgi:hypothetical protein
MSAPIVLFAYNRPTHLRQTIEALLKNPLASQSSLLIYADGAKDETDTPKVQAVRQYIQTIKGFAEIHIIARDRNWGLASSVIAGVSEVLDKYGKAIVLEDDMTCAENFLDFMNQALDFYQSDSQIFSVSGYTYPIRIPTDYPHDVFLAPRASSWGWATWLDRWRLADWQMTDYPDFIHNPSKRATFNQGGDDLSLMLKKQQAGQIDSWAVRWTYTHFKHKGYGLFPIQSKIQNIGVDNSGVHTPKTRKFEVNLHTATFQFPEKLQADTRIQKELQRFFRPPLWKRILNQVKYGL